MITATESTASESAKIPQEEIEELINNLVKITASQGKRLSKIERTLSFVDEHKVTELLDTTEQRIAALASKVQLHLLQLDVLTEVPRVYPERLPFLMHAVDTCSSDWWEAKRYFTIEQWAEVRQ